MLLFEASGLACRLSCGNGAAVETGLLLRDYLSLDGRARCLGTALRLWGRRVGADRPAEGTLPPHALPVLLVHFLQRERVLPLCHELLPPGRGPRPYSGAPAGLLADWHSGSSVPAAQLWVALFRWLALGLRKEGVVSIHQETRKTNFKGKRLTVEVGPLISHSRASRLMTHNVPCDITLYHQDPFSSKKNMCKHLTQQVLDYLALCFKTSYLYFGSIQTKLGPVIEELHCGAEQRPEEQPATGLAAWLAARGTRLTPLEAAAAVELVPRNMVHFSLETPPARLAPGPPPPPQCLVCGAAGHSQGSCPAERPQVLPKLPGLQPRYLATLSAVCRNVVLEWEPSEPELRVRWWPGIRGLSNGFQGPVHVGAGQAHQAVLAGRPTLHLRLLRQRLLLPPLRPRHQPHLQEHTQVLLK
jgi:hypothetical protein